MTWRRQVAITGLGSIVLLTVLIVVLTARIDPVPLRSGATTDEAWSFIHTNHSAAAPVQNFPMLAQRRIWRADIHTIQQETRLYWRTNRLLATRTVTYAYNTNSIITRVHSRWRLAWPFGR